MGAVARRRNIVTAGCGFCSCLDTKIITTVKRKIGLANVRLLISGGAPLSSMFSAFDAEPLGSASVAQVHRAVLHGSGEVALGAPFADPSAATLSFRVR